MSIALASETVPFPLAREPVFTTGQIAEMLELAPRTVSKLADSGALTAYRLPPLRQDRRVERAALLRFLKANDLPLTPLERQVLVVSNDRELVALIESKYRRDDTVLVKSIHEAFEVGRSLSSERCKALVLDCRGEGSEARAAKSILAVIDKIPASRCAGVVVIPNGEKPLVEEAKVPWRSADPRGESVVAALESYIGVVETPVICRHRRKRGG